ncbi:phage portal protein [Romboutsia lituseburensis]|uniref:phage portal protein n=1 Tax=Romboutsia lituseburensis TaxID=1537 RepID=UPI0022EACA7D|nr:phage portal protein [Romboutsia lituseburensis]
MRILDRFKNMFTKEVKNELSAEEKNLLRILGITENIEEDIKAEVTYFTCLKVLSENLGKLPLKLYQETDKGIVKAKNNNVYNLLRLRPNPYMNATTFWTTVEMNRSHYGNAYVYCNYKGTKLQDLWIMPSDQVRIMCDNAGYFGKKDKIWYVYNDTKTGKEYTIHADNVLHFKTSHTLNGIEGLAVKDILQSSVEGGLESQKFMNNLYKNGMTATSVLQYTGDLDEKAKARLIRGIESFANGSSNAGKIIPIPLGMQLTPLNLKLTDSQFFDLKKYNALQIAGAFGIKPTFINDYDKSSYSNSEAEQLSFLINTLQHMLKQYEEEISYKLLSTREINQGYFFKFNEGAVLRTDAKTQAEVVTKYVNNGIYTPNEARLLLNMTVIEGADILMCNGNYIPVQQVGNQYRKEGEIIEE